MLGSICPYHETEVRARMMSPIEPIDNTDPRTIVSKFLDSLTFGQIGTYTRIALYSISSFLVTQGVYSDKNTWVQPAIGALTFAATLGWTIWGQRLVNRIKALMQTGHITAVVAKSQAVADAVPDSRVTSANDTVVAVGPGAGTMAAQAPPDAVVIVGPGR